MTMEETPFQGEGLEGDPASGEVAGEPTQPEPESRQYVEVEDPDNRFVRVKVDGEEQEVPYSEALRGYSREADYTRKAQEVAKLRQEADFGLRVQRALQENPQLTLRILAEQHGIEFGPTPQPPPELEEEQYADPLEKAIAQERAARLALEERIRAREEDEQLDRAIHGLRQQFNVSDEDLNEVIFQAQRYQLSPDALPMLWKTMMFDRMQARIQATRQRDEQQRTEAERRQAAAAAASQTIGTGASANGLTPRLTDPDTRMSIREAIEAALDEAGFSGA